MRYAVIMAGGAGKRLWPLSRRQEPKQLLKLFGGKSLIQIAVDRLDGLFDPERIYIITNEEYADLLAEAAPNVPRENVIGEPCGRDTANAIALAAELLAAKDPEGSMAVFTADHIIRPQDCFEKSVQRGLDAVESDNQTLMTLGVRPTWPHTGLGYIEVGEEVDKGVFEVNGFKEKPDHTTARRYVEGGGYYWNSGMFLWTLPAIRAALREFLPETTEKLAPVHEAVKAGRPIRELLAEVYPSLEKISIDYAVMEKARKVRMVELRCEWIDMGSWPALELVQEPDDTGNTIVADNVAVMDSFRNIIVSQDKDHLVAVLGLDDCIVVHSEDATLVCNKDDSQRLKELVAAVEKHYGRKFI